MVHKKYCKTLYMRYSKKINLNNTFLLNSVLYLTDITSFVLFCAFLRSNNSFYDYNNGFVLIKDIIDHLAGQ